MIFQVEVIQGRTEKKNESKASKHIKLSQDGKAEMTRLMT